MSNSSKTTSENVNLGIPLTVFIVCVITTIIITALLYFYESLLKKSKVKLQIIEWKFLKLKLYSIFKMIKNLYKLDLKLDFSIKYYK